MKTIGFLKYRCIALFLTVLFAGCQVSTSASKSGKVPPGQAKKISGSKSAKAYAPGQNKKRKQ